MEDTSTTPPHAPSIRVPATTTSVQQDTQDGFLCRQEHLPADVAHTACLGREKTNSNGQAERL